MSHPLIQAQRQDEVLTLTFLPQPVRGMTIDWVEALAQQLADLPSPNELRVVVFQGDWNLSLDLAHWQALRQTQTVRVHRALQQLHRWRTRTLKTLPLALIAVIKGPCAGAALPLVEGCDLALCTPTATFDLPLAQAEWLGTAIEGPLGADPAVSPGDWLQALAGQTMGAAQAQDEGWVTCAVSEAEVPQRLAEWTQSLIDKDPWALQLTKETLAHVPHMDWDASVSYTAAKFAEIKALQAAAGGSSTRAHAIAGFLAGQSKPGLKG